MPVMENVSSAENVTPPENSTENVIFSSTDNITGLEIPAAIDESKKEEEDVPKRSNSNTVVEQLKRRRSLSWLMSSKKKFQVGDKCKTTCACSLRAEKSADSAVLAELVADTELTISGLGKTHVKIITTASSEVGWISLRTPDSKEALVKVVMPAVLPDPAEQPEIKRTRSMSDTFSTLACKASGKALRVMRSMAPHKPMLQTMRSKVRKPSLPSPRKIMNAARPSRGRKSSADKADPTTSPFQSFDDTNNTTTGGLPECGTAEDNTLVAQTTVSTGGNDDPGQTSSPQTNTEQPSQDEQLKPVPAPSESPKSGFKSLRSKMSFSLPSPRKIVTAGKKLSINMLSPRKISGEEADTKCEDKSPSGLSTCSTTADDLPESSEGNREQELTLLPAKKTWLHVLGGRLCCAA